MERDAMRKKAVPAFPAGQNQISDSAGDALTQPPTFLSRLLRKKPVELLARDMAGPEDAEHKHLKRGITPFQLTMFGVGSTIGTGIFFVLSETVPTAGPAVIVSFLMAGLVAGLTALCYAEMASMIPVSGSSYSYAYATLGEGVAFFVACCLILEYGISAAAVAVGWSGYLNEVFLIGFGSGLPPALLSGPLIVKDHGLAFGGDGILNLPAVILVLLCALLLIRGASESARANAIMVLIKLGILVMFIAIAATGFSAGNLQPFAPHGFAGVSTAAGVIFFTYVGLDAVSTAGEEVENPKRNLPLAIIAALVIVTTLYVLVAVTGLGVQPAAEFAGQEAGLAVILKNLTGSDWPALVLAGGAVISVFSVTLVVLYGQTRILFAMSRDGLLPELFYRVNPSTLSPVACTVVVGIFVALIAAFVPNAVLWELTSMGTLVAFTVVSAGVMVLRHTRPDMPRGFRVPFYPVLPLSSIASCIYLVTTLNPHTYELFAVWLVIGGVFYLGYGMRHSRLERAGRCKP
jgi:APA family basic amino acid/polyamine antiporter